MELIANFSGNVTIEDLRTVEGKDVNGEVIDIVISRTAEIKVIENSPPKI